MTHDAGARDEGPELELSVVIVNYNNSSVLEGCMRTLHDDLGGIEAEVILSDNGSRDGSVEWVEREFPKVRILRNAANLGFAEANNRAFAVARGRAVLLLNPDTLVRPGALRAMLDFLAEHSDAGIVGCKLIDPDGSRQISARSFPTLSTYAFQFLGLEYRYPRSPIFGRHRLTYWDGDTERQVDWMTGAALMVRREVLERTGGLDPYFFLTYDEVDWCRRIAGAGYGVWYTPRAEIVHLEGQSEPQSSPQRETRVKYLTVERNSRVHYFMKHHGSAYAAAVEALHIGLHGAFCIKARLFGTKQPARLAWEKGLIFDVYRRTARRVPRVLGASIGRLITGRRDRPVPPLFVNPYTAAPGEWE